MKVRFTTGARKRLPLLVRAGLGVVVVVGAVCFGQGEQAPEWFYWFVDHPNSPLVLPFGLPGRILTGDFNEDANADLILSAYQGPFISMLGPDYGPAKVHILMLLGNGHGGFEIPKLVLEAKGSLGIVLVADVNGDGHEDLVLARRHIILEEPNTEIQAMLGDGQGRLAAPVTLFPFPDILMDMAVGDVNNDGHLDFVLAHNIDQAVSIFLGDGRGGFRYHGSARLGQEPDHVPYRVVLAHFNRDGHLDLAVAGEVYEADERRTRFVRVLLGDGTGDFPHTSFFITLEPPEDEPPVWINLIAVDYNHDGHIDLITSRQDEMIGLVGKGNGTFERHELFGVQSACFEVIAVTDFNNNGIWDWVVALYCPPILGLRVRVTGGANYLWSPGTTVVAAVVDLNNDGYPDVVYATGHGREGQEVTRLRWRINNIRWGVRK